jgi:hypothetical protein
MKGYKGRNAMQDNAQQIISLARHLLMEAAARLIEYVTQAVVYQAHRRQQWRPRVACPTTLHVELQMEAS